MGCLGRPTPPPGGHAGSENDTLLPMTMTCDRLKFWSGPAWRSKVIIRKPWRWKNKKNNKIKKTIRHSRRGMPSNRLEVSLYTKPIDTHNYLNYQSCHPQNCKNGLPYGQFLRIKRNCTHHHINKEPETNLVRYLLQRGYPMELIRKAQDKCDAQVRASLLKTKEKPLNQISRVPLVLTYHPTNPPLIKIIKKYWRIIRSPC